MLIVNRRSALSLSPLDLTAAAVLPVLPCATSVRADGIQVWSPTDGVELGSGVRWDELGEVEPQIAAYSKVMFGNAIYQPGTQDPLDQPVMDTAMFCYILQGDFEITKAGLAPYRANQRQAYTCGKGKTANGRNAGDGVGSCGCR